MKKLLFSLIFFIPSLAFAGTMTFQTSLTDPLNATSYTFSAVSIGTASADRYVIVGFFGSNGSGDINSITIGGNGTTIATTTNSTDSAIAVGIVYANIPTGTTADIVVNFAFEQSRAGIGVWTATGLQSAVPVDVDTRMQSNTSANPSISDSISTASSGFAIGFAGSGSGPDNITAATWTNLTKDFDDQVEAAPVHQSGASATNPSDPTNVTFQWTSTSNRIGLALASWQFSSAGGGGDNSNLWWNFIMKPASQFFAGLFNIAYAR